MHDVLKPALKCCGVALRMARFELHKADNSEIANLIALLSRSSTYTKCLAIPQLPVLTCPREQNRKNQEEEKRNVQRRGAPEHGVSHEGRQPDLQARQDRDIATVERYVKAELGHLHQRDLQVACCGFSFRG